MSTARGRRAAPKRRLMPRHCALGSPHVDPEDKLTEAIVIRRSPSACALPPKCSKRSSPIAGCSRADGEERNGLIIAAGQVYHPDNAARRRMVEHTPGKASA
jgi:hypothetical protein